MHNESLLKSEWNEYFNDLSKKIAAKSLVEIEVEALGTTDRLETEWVKLYGITYDPKDDSLTVSCENLEHIMHHVQSISLNKDQKKVTSYEVNTADGYRHIVKFRSQLEI